MLTFYSLSKEKYELQPFRQIACSLFPPNNSDIPSFCTDEEERGCGTGTWWFWIGEADIQTLANLPIFVFDLREFEHMDVYGIALDDKKGPDASVQMFASSLWHGVEDALRP